MSTISGRWVKKIKHQSYRYIGSFGVFFLIFPKLAFLYRICAGYIGKLLIYRQYIADIEGFFFSKKRLSFAKIMSGWPDTRSIDDISLIFRDIFVHEWNFAELRSKVHNPFMNHQGRCVMTLFHILRTTELH